MPGYGSFRYADSLSEFGTPRRLAAADGWLLERQVPGSPLPDAMGSYPLFACRDWSGLKRDLDAMEESLVSLTMVPDPFGSHDEAYLRECFSDLVVPFKQHYVADMERPVQDIVSRHHLRCASKASAHIATAVCLDPSAFLEDWITLHQQLVARHAIRGIRAYSRRAFEKQLAVPGMVVLRALHKSTTVGAQLWYQANDVAYGHVLAFSQTGYRLGASYALYLFALQYFSGKVKWCDFGGIAGMQDNDVNQLGKFKEGWSTGTRTAYLCGRIFNREEYARLARARKYENTFFPAYRNSF